MKKNQFIAAPIAFWRILSIAAIIASVRFTYWLWFQELFGDNVAYQYIRLFQTAVVWAVTAVLLQEAIPKRKTDVSAKNEVQISEESDSWPPLPKDANLD